MLTSTSSKVTMEDIYEKYPNFQNDYRTHWRRICKNCLDAQVIRNPNSSRLGCVLKELEQTFSHYRLSDIELRVISKSLSSKFRNRLHDPEWDQWKQKLPKIFEGIEISNHKLMTFFKTNSDGVPESVTKVLKEMTFVVTVCSDDGDQVFKWSGVPRDIAMTSISEITKALA